MLTLTPRVLLVSVLLIVGACGGSGSGGGTVLTPEAPPVEPPPEIQTGVLWPVPIGGLSYSTPTESGTTNAAGEFQYQINDTIEFRLGDTVLGTSTRNTRVSNQISLFDLQSAPLLSDIREIIAALDDLDAPFTAAANLIRTLYSLDDDQNLDNGINVSADVSDLFASVALDFNREPTRFAYAGNVQTLLSAADRTLMPLEVSLAHQYQAANELLVEEGVTLARLRRVEQTLGSGDVIEGLDNTQYDYDALGNLVRQESFDREGQLVSSSVFEYDAQGLRIRRTLDSDGDGLTDVESQLQRNQAGDVIQTITLSGDALADQFISTRAYNALGQEVERTEDEGGDGSVESTTTTEYANNGRPARIEIDADGDRGVVITNTYDANDRLIEQTFDGIGTDVHDFQDSKPPPIGVTPLYRFDPQRPYWGVDAAFTAASPPSATPRSRRTRYVRDNQGRVIERRTDTNGDGVADQVAQLVFAGQPVSWRYDGQGDGEFESNATYTYATDGALVTVREEQALPMGVAIATRTLERGDDGPGRRFVRIRTTSNAVDPADTEVLYSLNDSGNRLRFTDVEGQDEEQTVSWVTSFRLDDSRLYSLPPATTGAFQFEYRDIGEPAVRDANGVLIGSYAGGDESVGYHDITVHFVGIPDPYLMRIIPATLDAVAPDLAGLDAVYEGDDCRDNRRPLIEAEDDGTPPRIVIPILDADVSDKPRHTFIADPDAILLTKTISQRYAGIRFGCATVADDPERGVYPLVPTTLKLAFPFTVDGRDLTIDSDPSLIVN